MLLIKEKILNIFGLSIIFVFSYNAQLFDTAQVAIEEKKLTSNIIINCLSDSINNLKKNVDQKLLEIKNKQFSDFNEINSKINTLEGEFNKLEHKHNNHIIEFKSLNQKLDFIKFLMDLSPYMAVILVIIAAVGSLLYTKFSGRKYDTTEVSSRKKNKKSPSKSKK